MSTIKLNAKTIQKIKAPDPSGKQVLHWDKDLRGFGILCSGVTNARTWVVQAPLRDGSGRRPRVSIGPVNVLDADEARSRAEKVIAAMLLGRNPKEKNGADTTLREALDLYLAGNSDLREKSREGYRGTIERWLSEWLDKPLRTITDEAIVVRLQEIREEVAAGGRYSGAATANMAMRALRAVWNDAALRDKALTPWPTKRLSKKWHQVPRREGMVKFDDLPKFHAAVLGLPNPIQRDYLLTLLYTGMRRGEAASLTWCDVDFAGRVVRLPAARTKSGRRFDVPMTDLMRDLLVARRALGKEKFVFPADSA
ncbi:MAG TPA: tyrosine-type recombinase/integrase, partial [Stellaceae bacterium]|nr:tyrosine-type recombinase/integrase [Stellaceae bacterium]